MSGVSFSRASGVGTKDSMGKSWFSSLDGKEALIGSDAGEVSPFRRIAKRWASHSREGNRRILNELILKSLSI